MLAGRRGLKSIRCFFLSSGGSHTARDECLVKSFTQPVVVVVRDQRWHLFKRFTAGTLCFLSYQIIVFLFRCGTLVTQDERNELTRSPLKNRWGTQALDSFRFGCHGDKDTSAEQHEI